MQWGDLLTNMMTCGQLCTQDKQRGRCCVSWILVDDWYYSTNTLVSRKETHSLFICSACTWFVLWFKSSFMDFSALSLIFFLQKFCTNTWVPHESQIIGRAKLKVLKMRLNWRLGNFYTFRGIKAPCGVAAAEQRSRQRRVLQPSWASTFKIHFENPALSCKRQIKRKSYYSLSSLFFTIIAWKTGWGFNYDAHNSFQILIEIPQAEQWDICAQQTRLFSMLFFFFDPIFFR